MRCKITGCELDACWQVGMLAWAQGRTKENSGPLSMATGIVVCDFHKENPPTPAAEMFPPEGREAIQAALRATGKAPVNFESAEFVFAAVTPERCEALARGDLEGMPDTFEAAAIAAMQARRPPERIEDQSIERYWHFFEGMIQPVDEHIRGMLRDAFQAGASTIALLWHRCEQESDERRRAMAQQIKAECDRLAQQSALEQMPAAGTVQ
ncbi:MAG TPA: hypothetical protein VJ303_06465 [Steroidobacteraceae bacterium]|nr:hypothetical protein [Steroidobacteraceae bacterium]